MFQDEQTSPGARAIKLSEPMWTSFFELHTGPWRKSGHNMRPDTRAIEASSRPNRLKITLQNWGHPHTPLPALSRRLENCALPDRSRECGCRSSAPPSPAQCRAGLASYDTRRRGHPPHQLSATLCLIVKLVHCSALGPGPSVVIASDEPWRLSALFMKVSAACLSCFRVT